MVKQDIHFENQRIYCQNNRLPFFSLKSCDHSYPWMDEKDNYGLRQSLGEMLVEKYGEDKAFHISSGTHITSCPSCGRSWCD